MRKQLFAQVWELVRNQPLLTCISVLGTAFAITMIMVIVIVWQTKYADLAPEVNRSRCLYISAVGVQQKDNKSYGGYSSCSPAFMKRCVEGVPGVEACTAFSPATDALVSLSDGGSPMEGSVSRRTSAIQTPPIGTCSASTSSAGQALPKPIGAATACRWCCAPRWPVTCSARPMP